MFYIPVLVNTGTVLFLANESEKHQRKTHKGGIMAKVECTLKTLFVVFYEFSFEMNV